MAKKMAPFVFSWRYLAFAKYQSSLLNLILTLKKNTGNILDISIYAPNQCEECEEIINLNKFEKQM